MDEDTDGCDDDEDTDGCEDDDEDNARSVGHRRQVRFLTESSIFTNNEDMEAMIEKIASMSEKQLQDITGEDEGKHSFHFFMCF